MSVGNYKASPFNTDVKRSAPPHKHVFSHHPNHGSAAETAKAADPNPFGGNNPPSANPGSPKV